MLIIFQILKSIYSNKNENYSTFLRTSIICSIISWVTENFIWPCVINSVAIRGSIRIKSTGLFASRFSEFYSMGPPLVSRAFRSVLGLIAPHVDRVESISQYLRMEFEKGARSDRTLEAGALRHVSQAKILCCSRFKRARGLRVRQVTGRARNGIIDRAGRTFQSCDTYQPRGSRRSEMRLCAAGTGHERKSARDTISDSWETFGYLIYSDRPATRSRSVSSIAVKRCRQSTSRPAR